MSMHVTEPVTFGDILVRAAGQRQSRTDRAVPEASVVDESDDW